MPISGIILTLTADPDRRAVAMASLERHAMIEVGEERGLRRAVVVDSPDEETDRSVWQWLHEIDGVTFVELVSVYFDRDQPSDDDSASGDL